MIDPTNYNINIRKVESEGACYYEAKVKELPDIAEYGDTVDEAYSLAVDSIVTTAEVFDRKGKEMPSPFIPADDFSGRVTLRINKSLHRFLSEVSEEEGVSLNQHICNILNYYAGTYLARPEVVVPQPTSAQKSIVMHPASENRHLKLVSKTDRPLAAANQDWR